MDLPACHLAALDLLHCKVTAQPSALALLEQNVAHVTAQVLPDCGLTLHTLTACHLMLSDLTPDSLTLSGLQLCGLAVCDGISHGLMPCGGTLFGLYVCDGSPHGLDSPQLNPFEQTSQTLILQSLIWCGLTLQHLTGSRLMQCHATLASLMLHALAPYGSTL